jgi:hypothetical protein
VRVARLTRRSFLKKGLIGGVLLAGAGIGLAKFPGRLTHKPRRPLRVLDEREFATLGAVAARVIQAPHVDPVEIAHRADESLVVAVPEVRHDVKQLLTLFENALAGALFDFRFKPFTRLEPAQQDAALLKWRDSRIAVRRTGYVTLRKLAAGYFYCDPATWHDIGYAGPPSLPT